jgi:alkylation response protein AidB-like acyl-CoA dehydrogenase
VQENLNRMSQADLMGFTLPRKNGGLNCPCLIYTMATEMISRADTSLMNMFGLQGIAETIYAFANDEIKDESLPRFCRGEVTSTWCLDRARRRQRPAGRAAAGLRGRAGQLASQRREAASITNGAAKFCWCLPVASRKSATAAA